MGRLATQTAAHKLGQILGLLVIPILMLWTAYYLQAKRDIDEVSFEIAEVEQVRDLIAQGADPIMLGRTHRIEAISQDADLKSFDYPNTVLTLQQRKSAQWRNLLLLSGAGFLSAFAGIALSIMLMRSTLMQLDTAERARIEAQEAKQDAEQTSLQFTTINNDISNLNKELALKVRELRTAQDELLRQGRIEQLGQITATIAHEIRNPLGAIRTSAFMLERKTSKAGLDTGELLERINKSVNRCDMIISQLHDYAKVKEPNNQIAKLDDWLSKVVRDEAARLPPQVFIECSLGLGDLQLSFDPVQLQRAVVNVLNNACEALQVSDGQPDKTSGLQKTIWVTTLRHGAHASIRIADNGPGITPENLKKIREPLFTTKSFGSGLGIPVVEQIMQTQGGTLDIASEPGAGAKFTLNIPVLMQDEATHAA